MIAETGHAALWLACALSALGAWRADWSHAAAVASAVCAGVALCALGWAFTNADFSVAAVRAGVNLTMSAETRMAALWAEWPGKALLLLVALGAAVGWFALSGRSGPVAIRALRWQCALQCAGSAAVLGLQPFRRLDPAPTDGIGLDGAWQAAGPAWNPPLMALGIGVFAVALTLELVTASPPLRPPRLVRVWMLASLALCLFAGAWVAIGRGEARLAYTDLARVPLVMAGLSAGLLQLGRANSAKFWRTLSLLGRAGRMTLLAGMALIAAGVVLDRAVRNEAVMQLAPGEIADAGGMRVALDGVLPVAGPGYTAVRSAVRVCGVAFAPERRVYFAPPGEVSPPYRGHGIAGWTDVSLIPADGRWRIRIEHRPFAMIAPLGFALTALGAAALAGAQLRLPRHKRSWDRRAAYA